MLFSPLVERAMRVAARSHRHQTRKASDLPYISHPAGMAILLARAGFDDDCLLAAALLHDTIEDTDYSTEELAEEFPAEVGRYVAALTERKHDAQNRPRPWRDRKEEHLEEVKAAPLEARAIVLADKLHNLGTILYDLRAGEDIWTRFNASPEDVLWYHRAMVATAACDDPRIQSLVRECNEIIEELANGVA